MFVFLKKVNATGPSAVQGHIARGRDVGPYHNCFAQIANVRFDGISVRPQMSRVLDLAPASPFAWAGFTHFVERDRKRTCGAMMAGGSSSNWHRDILHRFLPLTYEAASKHRPWRDGHVAEAASRRRAGMWTAQYGSPPLNRRGQIGFIRRGPGSKA